MFVVTLGVGFGSAVGFAKVMFGLSAGRRLGESKPAGCVISCSLASQLVGKKAEGIIKQRDALLSLVLGVLGLFWFPVIQ